MRVLVADDLAENRYFLEALLRGNGFEVTSECDGAAALEELRRAAADLVISDILMPGMDGYQLCRALKSDARLASIPVVFYTATYTSDEDRSFALGLGASRFIVKPTDPEEFVGIIREVLAEARRGHLATAEPTLVETPDFHRQHDALVTKKLEKKVEELEASEARYRMLFDSSPDPLLVCEVATGRLLDASPAASRLYGYTREELLLMWIVDLSAEPEETARASREGVELVPICYHRRKDGTVFPVEITASYRDQEGQRVSLISVRDIRARLEAEEDLRRLTAAVEQVGETVMITDAEGTIVYANPSFERVTGFTREEALGRKPSLLKSGKHPPELYRSLWDTICAGRTWTGRFVNRRKDGSLFEEEAVISPVRDRNGAIVNYVAVKRDVTEEVALRRQLEQAQKMEAVGRLAGGIAHDFNNLLTVILGRANLALGLGAIDHAVRADLEEIQAAAERAAALTSQLLVFSRKQALQPRTVDLSEVVENAGKLLGRLIGEDVEVATVLSRDLPAVRVDPGQMEQVILNLGVNARDAMPRGGRLTIETASVFLDEEYASHHPHVVPGRHVMLGVSDTGTGMDSETRARIFDPFFTTKEAGKGTGLGLSIVHGIVQQSGGSIWVYSEPGQGTTFKIYLPAAPGAEGSVPPPVPTFAPRGDETVLLVEDEAAVRRLTATLLRSSGYTVLEASSGDEALALLSKGSGPVHLLLTDFVMPRINGRDLAERAQAVRPDLRVLYMSGYTDAGFLDRTALGPADSLQKPFTKAALAQKVREVLDRQG